MPLHDGDTADESEFTIPEPPPRGTLAWRRLLLGICSADDYDTFHQQLDPVWQWRGWRVAVDITTEMLAYAVHTAPAGPPWRDVFGALSFKPLLTPVDEAAELIHSAGMARALYGDLPPHEALARAMDEGELFWVSARKLVPLWDRAAAAIESSGGDQQAAWPVLMPYLSGDARQRNEKASLMVGIAHGLMRSRVLPEGTAWVGGYLMPAAPAVTMETLVLSPACAAPAARPPARPGGSRRPH